MTNTNTQYDDSYIEWNAKYENDYEFFFTKTIYWKDDNLLGIHSVVGIYSVVNLKSTNDEYIDDNYMTVRDMENLIKLVK